MSSSKDHFPFSLLLDIVLQQVSLLQYRQNIAGICMGVCDAHAQVADQFFLILMEFQQPGPPEAVQPTGQVLDQLDYCIVAGLHGFLVTKLLYYACN